MTKEGQSVWEVKMKIYKKERIEQMKIILSSGKSTGQVN